MTRAAIDERGFELARRVRQKNNGMPLSDFKALVREQFNMLLIDQDAALKAIPALLPSDVETRQKAFGLIKEVLSARGEVFPEEEKRVSEVARLFDVDEKRTADQIPIRRTRKEHQAKIS